MEDKKPDLKDEQKMEAAKNAVTEKSVEAAPEPTAQEMSKGIVSDTPTDTVQGYSDQLRQEANRGVDAEGNVLSNEQRVSRFNAAKGLDSQAAETRFTMPQQATAPAASAPAASAPAASAPAASAPAASAVETTAVAKPGIMSRLTPALTEGRYGGALGRTGAAVGLGVVDSILPRGDNNTALGYGINRLRDAGMGAAQTEILGADRIANPWLRAGADLVGAGMGLYHGYGQDQRDAQVAAAPQPTSEYQYKTPQAQPNFWSQGGAVLSDAGHIYDQATGALKKGLAYDIDNYTPYPIVEKGVQSVANYFTPPGMIPKAPESNDDDAAVTLPPNVKQEADGTYTKSVYDNRGNYLGYSTSSTPYDREVQSVLNPDPVTKAISQSSIPTVSAPQPITEAQLPEISSSRLSATNAQNQISPVNYSNWNAVQSAQEVLRTAQKALPNGNPLHDAPIAYNIANAAKTMAIARGANPEDKNFAEQAAAFFPNSGRESDAQINEMAYNALKGGTQENLVHNAIFQNSGGSEQDLAYNKHALDQNSKQESVARNSENDVLRGENQQLKSDREIAREANQQKTSDRTIIQNYIRDLNTQIAERKLSDPTMIDPETKQLAQQRDKYMARLGGMLSEDNSVPKTDTDETVSQPPVVQRPNPKDLKVGQVIDTPKGKMVWNGKGLIASNKNG